MLKDIDSVLSYEFENIKKNIDKLYREVKLKYDYYSNPDTVIFRKDNFILTVADVLENRGFVELPKEYIGQFIGKGGKNIKELSKKLGIQLKVKEKGEEEKQKENIGYRPPRI